MPKLSAGRSPGRSPPTSSITDTGAQLTVVPRTLLSQMGVKPDSIFPIQTKVQGDANSPLMVDGGFLVVITARNETTGIVRSTRQLAYVSAAVKVPYLSFDACVDLGLIQPDFSQVGSHDESAPAMINQLSPTKCSNSGVPLTSESMCSCPIREMPPSVPPSMCPNCRQFANS